MPLVRYEVTGYLRVSPIWPDRGALPHDGGSAEVAEPCGLGARRWKVAHYGYGHESVMGVLVAYLTTCSSRMQWTDWVALLMLAMGAL